jgi:hypothetical protein
MQTHLLLLLRSNKKNNNAMRHKPNAMSIWNCVYWLHVVSLVHDCNTYNIINFFIICSDCIATRVQVFLDKLRLHGATKMIISIHQPSYHIIGLLNRFISLAHRKIGMVSWHWVQWFHGVPP